MAYGINTDLFPISLQDALVLSHQAFLSVFLKGTTDALTNYRVLMLESLGMGVSVTVMTAIMLVLKNNKDKTDNYASLRGRVPRFLKSIPFLSGLFAAFLVYVGPRLFFVVVSLFGVLPVFGYFNAIKDAKDSQAKSTYAIDSSKAKEERCDILILPANDKDGSSKERKLIGDIIAANEKWVAIATNKKTLVFPIENSEMQFHQGK